MNSPIKIALVEDNTDYRKSLVKSLASLPDFRIIADYPSCEAAEKEMLIQISDIVLLDIQLPGKSGIEFIDWLLNAKPEILIIMLTVNYDNAYIFDSIRKGAVGFLLKSATDDEIIRAIYEAAEGGSPMTPSVARKVLGEFQKKRITILNDEQKLKDREKEVLDLLAEGLSYKEIGKKLFISSHTVNHHLRNIYKKLQVNTRAEAIAKVNLK